MELSHKNGNDRVMGRSWAAAADATGSDCSVNNLTVINNEAFHSGVNGIDRAQKSVVWSREKKSKSQKSTQKHIFGSGLNLKFKKETFCSPLWIAQPKHKSQREANVILLQYHHQQEIATAPSRLL